MPDTNYLHSFPASSHAVTLRDDPLAALLWLLLRLIVF